MYRSSAVVDSSGKWASAEEILANNPRKKNLSRPTSSTLNDWGIESSIPGNQAENAPVGRKGDIPRLSYHPSATSASALSYLTSQPASSPLSPISHHITRPDGRISLVPIRSSSVSQTEQAHQIAEIGDSMLQTQSAAYIRPLSNPTPNHIKFPNPRLTNPNTHVPQYDYRPNSIPAPSFANGNDNSRSSSEMLKSHPFTTTTTQYEVLSRHGMESLDPQGSPIHSGRAVRPDAFVAIDPFRPQIRHKYEKDPSTFDDIPIPVHAPPTRGFYVNSPSTDQHHQANSNSVELHAADEQQQQQRQLFTELASPAPVNQENRPSERVRRPSSDGHGYTAKDDVEYLKEGQAQALLLPPPPKQLAPVRRTPGPSDTGHNVKLREGSLEQYGSYSWKPPLGSSQSHSNSYAPNSQEQDARAALKKGDSFWTNLSGYLVWPFNSNRSKRLRAEYGFTSPHTHPSPSFSSSGNGSNSRGNPGAVQVVGTFIARTIPTQLYILLLLRVPSFYFSRVARIFEEVGMTLEEIKKMVLEMGYESMDSSDDAKFRVMSDSEKVVEPPRYRRLKLAWEEFVDEVIGEWKMVNIISVLLLSAILTTLQIANAAEDPVIRYTALVALICALMSLAFGCVYVLRFGTMRKIWKAAEWALEAKKKKTFLWWNVWVMLAMPVVWLAWSVILYITCIMIFVWRTSSRSQDNSSAHGISDTGQLVVRIVISALLGLGIIYMVLAMHTLGRYGDEMDRRWKRRIWAWVREEEEEKRRRDLNGYQISWRPTQPVSSVSQRAIPSAAYDVNDQRDDDYGHGHSSGVSNQNAKADAKLTITTSTANYVLPTLPVFQTSYQHVQDKPGQRQLFGKGPATGNGAADFNSSALKAPPPRLGLDKDSKKTSGNAAAFPLSPEENEDPGSANVRRRAKTASLAIPPPASLPPIPGTPMSGLSGPRSRSVKTTTTTIATGNTSSTTAFQADRSFRHYSGFSLDSRMTAQSAGAAGLHVFSPKDESLSVNSGNEYLGSDRLGDTAGMDEEESISARSPLSNEELEMGTDTSMSVPRTPVPSPATVSPR